MIPGFTGGELRKIFTFITLILEIITITFYHPIVFTINFSKNQVVQNLLIATLIN